MVGGLGVIGSVFGILVFLVTEAAPLLGSAQVEPLASFPVQGTPGALVVDEHRTHVAALGQDGELRVYRTADAAVVAREDLLVPREDGGPRPTAARVQALPDEPALALATSDGRVTLQPLSFRVRFDGAVRRIEPVLLDPIELDLGAEDAGPLRIQAFAVQVEGDTVAAALASEREGVRALLRASETNDFTGETTVEERSVSLGRVPVRTLAFGPEARDLFATTADGRLLWWDLRRGDSPVSGTLAQPASGLGLLIGGRGLVVGGADGSLDVWFAERQGAAGRRLERIRGGGRHDGAVRHVATSARDRTVAASSEDGALRLYYSTSDRELWRGRAPVGDVTALAYAPKGDALYVASPGRIDELAIDNPHPQFSWQALFGRVRYEGYGEPAFVWQSTGGTDEFEPKLSLTPLLVGTLKGTFYSLLLAVPLGILGALYTSQFIHPALQRVIKPTIEIMASLPSVVLGFLAGLWLAPRLEGVFPSLFLMMVTLPLIALAVGALWSSLPRRFTGRLFEGAELVPHAAALSLGMWLCVELSPAFEVLAFDGSFSQWLNTTTGLAYDQRNAIVVGLAMGFAVIPIIFSISDDAFTAVPRSLSAASLALGASRWQTVARVVLPAASPGLFAAVMIGFGRAVGETMIVLMATGNTPVLDWNPFNGFRTLSANIAVEIPEAPQGGTLYRLLFVAALLLFALTFMINTISEVVRQRLRHRFGRF